MSVASLYFAMGIVLVICAILSVLSWLSGNGAFFLLLAVVLVLGTLTLWLEYPMMEQLTVGEVRFGYLMIALSLLAAGLLVWTLTANPEFSRKADHASTKFAGLRSSYAATLIGHPSPRIRSCQWSISDNMKLAIGGTAMSAATVGKIGEAI